MSDTLQEIADIPKDFFKDGTAFLNRCTKRTSLCSRAPKFLRLSTFSTRSFTSLAICEEPQLTPFTADRREFIKISQAVGMGFLIMGAIGYVIKLIHIPVNNILVGGA
jgi:protein transport protein SEC61 subunit gamma-like protein